MSKLVKKIQKSLGIAGHVVSLTGLAYNFWRSFSVRTLCPTQVYSLKEVAGILGTSQEEAIELIQEGNISAHKLGGGYKILGSSVIAFLEK